MAIPRRAAFLLPLSLAGAGCRKPSTPEAAAGAFIDAYYIEKDHGRALELADEGAAERIRQEQKLLGGAAGSYRGEQPRVFYTLAEKKDGERLVYALTIDSGGEKMAKRLTVVTKKKGEEYRVTFFQEDEAPVK